MLQDRIYRSLLWRLASLYGIQIYYYGVDSRRHYADDESLMAILNKMGAPVTCYKDIPAVLRAREYALLQQMVEPVLVAWDGVLRSIPIRCSGRTSKLNITGHLIFETGEEKTWVWNADDTDVIRCIASSPGFIIKIPFLISLPFGYHRLILEISGRSFESLIISAPRKTYMSPEIKRKRIWGLFLPLYALQTEKNWGCGDFSSLEALQKWVSGLGGDMVATLPLLASFLDSPYDPSPYAPVSRLFWNEIYLDVDNIPELLSCPSAQSMLSSSVFQKELNELRDMPFVEYRRLMEAKRRVLMELSRSLFAGYSRRQEDLHNYVARNLAVQDYARFRAVCEKQKQSWKLWPGRLRNGKLTDSDCDKEIQQYHLYVQWLTGQQIEQFSHKAQHYGAGLYLDFPVGVHPDGYDVWCRQDVFLPGCSLGAPPDAVFTSGQNWNCPPLNPEKLRQNKYDYFISCLQHNMRYAGILRIDHMMSFHHLYWIPGGMESTQGVYVRYRSEELYAILTLESHRNNTMIVGEDLGLVPPEVRPAMSRHGLQRMYIMQYELISDSNEPLHHVPVHAVASLNTHDMPPFAAFWHCDDIRYRYELGLINKKTVRKELKERRILKNNIKQFLRKKSGERIYDKQMAKILQGLITCLNESPAEIILLNLEDLWLETQPQNVPGTNDYPNWQRKARYSFEEFSKMPQVLKLLHIMNKYL